MTVLESRPSGQSLPSGEVAFLIADVEDSTRKLLELGSSYNAAQDEAFRILRTAIDEFGGVAFKFTGDGLVAAFSDPIAATSAAIAAQRGLGAASAPGALLVRVGVHLGPATPTPDDADYVSLTLTEATRVCDAGHGGQILLSEATAQAVADRLPSETSLRDRGPHLLKGLPSPMRLHEVVGPGLAGVDRPLRAARIGVTARRERSSFVGRGAELDALVGLVGEFPLVTVVGPGGVGKTRLLREGLTTIQHRFPEGAWFVPLGEIAERALIPAAVASVLGIGEIANADVVAGLMQRLRDAQLVIALDNCEQVIEPAAEFVSHLLAECPGVQVVATSREPLNLAEEALLELAPLEVPSVTDGSAPEIAASSAVQLFTERARQVDRTFELTPDNARHVARICQLADGLPLAIELIAPLIRGRALTELVTEIESRAITIEGRGRPRRHLSLHASIDWGYRLLTEVEQRVFRRLSVFAGGFTRTAANSVIADAAVPPDTVSQVLDRLLDKSLLTNDVEDRGRYRLLETIRMFAAAELTASGEAAAVGRAHALWCLELVESTDVEAEHRALAADRDNLRAALAWFAANDHQLLCRLALGLVPFWRVRGEFAEGRRWLAATHGPASGAPADSLALAEGSFAFVLGDYADAFDLLNRAIAGFAEAGDGVGVARAMQVLGRIAAYRGDGDGARLLFGKALAGFRSAGDEASAAAVLRALGRLARYRGDYEESKRYIDEALAASARAQSAHELAETLHDLGRLANRRGDYAAAADLLERALGQYREIGEEQGAANALYGLARAFLGKGDETTGINLLRAAVDRFRALGDLHGGGWPMGALARVLLDQDDQESAAALFEEAFRTGERLDSDPIRMMALVGLADVSAARQDYDAMHDYLLRARKLAHAIGYRAELADIEARLARHEVAHG